MIDQLTFYGMVFVIMFYILMIVAAIIPFIPKYRKLMASVEEASSDEMWYASALRNSFEPLHDYDDVLNKVGSVVAFIILHTLFSFIIALILCMLWPITLFVIGLSVYYSFILFKRKSQE